MADIMIELKSKSRIYRLWFTVIGMHKSDKTVERTDFSKFDETRRLTIDASKDAQGSIYFLLRITFKIWGSTPIKPDVPMPLSNGFLNYRCSFDYEFADGRGLSAKDLILSNAVWRKEDYAEGDYGQVVLSSFNPDLAPPGSHKFVRINPSILLPGSGISDTSTFNASPGGLGGSVATGKTETNPQSPIAFGSFKIDILVRPEKCVDVVEFVEDMAVALYYGEKETAFTKANEGKVLEWVKKINGKYPKLAEAIRKEGGPHAYVDGFASITGDPLKNQTAYADPRLRAVKDYVAKQLAIPANLISGKPYGSQNATWHYDFDSNGNVTKRPNPEDRRVIVFIDVKEASEILRYSGVGFYGQGC